MAESVDAQRWGRCGIKPVEVQVFSAAPHLSVTHWNVSTFGDTDQWCEKKVTCDDYPISFIASDPHVGHKKYYVFRSQFDVQIFSSLLFVENNGRGTISFGKCKVTRP